MGAKRSRSACGVAVRLARWSGLAAEPQYDPGPDMVGIALDGGVELGGHRCDDALTQAGRARIGLGIVADAVVGNRQDEIVALNAVLTVTRKTSERTVRASREAIRKPSSGMTPRISGSTQNRVGSSALSAIGKMPQAYARKSTAGVISDEAESREVMREP